MEIRFGEKKDIPAAAALEAACFSAPADAGTLERMLDRPDCVFLCAAEGEELLGYAWFQTVAVRKNYYERPREDAVLMTVFFRRED